MPVYAVRVGWTPGVYHTWSECKAAIYKYTRPIFRKFATPEEAVHFFETGHILEAPEKKEPQKHVAAVCSHPETGQVALVVNHEAVLDQGVLFAQHTPSLSLYGVLRILEYLTQQKQQKASIQIWVDQLHVYNILNKYLDQWEHQNWHKTRAEPLPHVSLLQTLQTLRKTFSNICYRFREKYYPPCMQRARRLTANA